MKKAAPAKKAPAKAAAAKKTAKKEDTENEDSLSDLLNDGDDKDFIDSTPEDLPAKAPATKKGGKPLASNDNRTDASDRFQRVSVQFYGKMHTNCHRCHC